MLLVLRLEMFRLQVLNRNEMSIRKFLLILITIILFTSLLLEAVLSESEYQKVRIYELPISMAAIVGLIALFLTRNRLKRQLMGIPREYFKPIHLFFKILQYLLYTEVFFLVYLSSIDIEVPLIVWFILIGFLGFWLGAVLTKELVNNVFNRWNQDKLSSHSHESSPPSGRRL